jgi:hypothetical protein
MRWFLPCPHVRRMRRALRNLCDRRMWAEGARIRGLMERGEPFSIDDLVGYARAMSGYR